MQARDDAFDLELLRAPVSDDAPVGVDLDGTLALDALETAAREPDEPSIAGVARIDARDWRAIEADARALLATSKDLRVAVILCRALSERHGVAGFAAGAALLADLLAQHGAAIYPLPDDDGDPTIRINTLKALASPAQLAALRAAELVSAPALGRFDVNAVLIASDSPAGLAGDDPPAPEHVLAAIEAGGAAHVSALRAAVRGAQEALRAVIAQIGRDTGQPLALSALVAPPGERRPGLLDALEAVLAGHEARLVPDANGPSSAPSSAAPAPPRAAPDGAIRRREDVLRVLDTLVAYYAREEPSSPVPLLLKRARRLATMDFLEIIEDLAQAGMPQVATVAGIPSE